MINYLAKSEWEDFDEFFQRSLDHFTSIDLSKHLITVNHIIDRLIGEGFESKIQVIEYLGNNAKRISKIYSLYYHKFFYLFPENYLFNDKVNVHLNKMNSTYIEYLCKHRKSNRLHIKSLSLRVYKRYYNEITKLKD